MSVGLSFYKNFSQENFRENSFLFKTSTRLGEKIEIIVSENIARKITVEGKCGLKEVQSYDFPRALKNPISEEALKAASYSVSYFTNGDCLLRFRFSLEGGMRGSCLTISQIEAAERRRQHDKLIKLVNSTLSAGALLSFGRLKEMGFVAAGGGVGGASFGISGGAIGFCIGGPPGAALGSIIGGAIGVFGGAIVGSDIADDYKENLKEVEEEVSVMISHYRSVHDVAASEESIQKAVKDFSDWLKAKDYIGEFSPYVITFGSRFEYTKKFFKKNKAENTAFMMKFAVLSSLFFMKKGERPTNKMHSILENLVFSELSSRNGRNS